MKKSQGEIFGVALLFVVIIIGFIVYAKFQAMNPNSNVDSTTKAKYEILSQSTLNSLIQFSTGCFVENGKDSVKDLVVYSQLNSFSLSSDPTINCAGDISRPSAKYSIQILNQTLFSLFNSSNSISGPIPFLLQIRMNNKESLFHSINLTNFGQFNFSGVIINDSNYLYYGFNRAPSGLRIIPTGNRNVNLILYLYFR